MVGKKAFTLAEVFHPAEQSKKNAFTLAEVLITLGIIGVVAAMTMPVLMSKYREQVTMNKLKKFYSIMSQVQLRSITDNGEMETWDWVPAGGESNNEIVMAWFNKYFGQYLQKAEVLDRKVLQDNELVDGGVTVLLSDGSVVNFGAFAGGYMHIYYFTDYKTFKNETAIQGKDEFLFGFGLNTSSNNSCIKRFNAYGCYQSKERLENGYYTYQGCNSNAKEVGSVLCTRILQLNNWQVPKDYPFKF